MSDFKLERRALINHLRHATQLYAAGSATKTYLQPVLSRLAEDRAARAARWAAEWGFDDGVANVVTAAELDDLARRIDSSLEALAALIDREERQLAELVADLPESALPPEERDALDISARDARQVVLSEVMTLRASAERFSGRDLGLTLGRNDILTDAPAKPPAYIYRLWFGTNRQPLRRGRTLVDFSSERSNVIHYGECEVTVPETHRIGSVGSPWWYRIGRGDDRLTLGAIRDQAADVFWAAIRERVAATAEPGDALVFLHGYNVSFKKAAVRAAQIGADLSLAGVMAFFSWPSRDRLLQYSADEATIEASELQITQFLVDVAERSGARAVHVIAHSMGNRGLLRAVQRIAANAAAASAKPFGQIILAAPDVDAGTFRALAAAYPLVAQRTTLYVSQADLAVRSSRLLHGADRIGFAPPVAIVCGIDTVNVTGVDLSLLGHGYVGECRPVLYDMHEVLTRGTEPRARAMLRERQDAAGQLYWEIAA